VATLTKIIIVLPNLKFGGVEKMRLLLAQSWILKGYDVEVVVLRKVGELVNQYEISDVPVSIHELRVDRISAALFPLARYLRKQKPDIVLSAMWPLTTMSVLAWIIAGRPGKVFLSEHTQLSVSRNMELNASLLFMRASIIFSHLVAHGVIAVSQGVKNDLVKTFLVTAERVKVIYNPACQLSETGNALKDLNYKIIGEDAPFLILTVGELKDQKKHDHLIQSFARLPSREKCRLYIIGEGAQRPQLEKLITDLNLEDRVFLPGFFGDVSDWYRRANLFVLSSGWEGFGNVIVEALSYGVPVVSTNCPSGPSEILENGAYGTLVPCGDIPALTSAIEENLWKSHDVSKLRRRAQDFGVERISNQYLEYFQESKHAL
jgi:glycosyltransferase involved in cell wall biosynthesis